MISRKTARRPMEVYLDDLAAQQRPVTLSRRDLSSKERKILGLDQEDEVADFVILDDQTIEAEFGWVFFYDYRSHTEGGDDAHMTLGNAPIIIDCANGALHVTGTAEPIETYIENFGKYGSPHG